MGNTLAQQQKSLVRSYLIPVVIGALLVLGACSLLGINFGSSDAPVAEAAE